MAAGMRDGSVHQPAAGARVITCQAHRLPLEEFAIGVHPSTGNPPHSPRKLTSRPLLLQRRPTRAMVMVFASSAATTLAA